MTQNPSNQEEIWDIINSNMSVDWKALPSLSALRAFEAVAGEDGFSGAARKLNVTHAAISQQVRALERDLGVALAVRSGRKITLTDAGASLALALGDGFSTIALAIEELRGREARRSLRVTTTPFIVDAVIMPRLSEFWAQHPGVEIALLPSVRYVDLVKDGFDLAVRATPKGGTWPGTDVTHLADSRWMVVATPDLIEAKNTHDPLALPWVWTEALPGEIEILRLADVDIDAIEKIEVGSETFQMQAVLRGLGVTLASEHVAREHLASGRLIELPMDGLRSNDAYVAVVPKGPRHPKADAFIEWLRSVF